MWVKPEQLDVAICRLHHKNKSIVKKTDGGNVPVLAGQEKHLCLKCLVAFIIHLTKLTEHAAAAAVWLEQQNLLSSESLLFVKLG